MNRIIRGFQKNYNNLAKSKYLLNNYKSNDWIKYINFDIENYKKNLVYRNNDFEIFVTCWLPNQETKIHNHSKNGCLIKILEGNMKEITYNTGSHKVIGENIMKTNDIRYIDDSICYHKMINNTEFNCISLHIYSPPLFVPSFLV